MNPETQTIQNRYQTEKILGQGRLSTVYRALDLQTNRTIALKILQPHLRTQTSIVQRFKREMAAVQRLDHPAIIRIFDIIETPEHLALAMEFAPGIDLKTWLQTHGPMPPTRTTKIAQTLLEALAQAHNRGILHRDLNLANVIIDEPGQNKTHDDRIEIIGFGLARVDELVGLTMHTRVLGTLETMAPEAVLGKTVDTQADLFSIGAILYELITATPLHDGRMSSGLAFATSDNYLESVRSNLKTALQDTNPNLLHTIIRALAPDPSLRFATATQMLDALLGNYAEATWTALETTPSPTCNHCSRPLLESTTNCLYCGHAPKNLIKNPGQDEYSIHITRTEVHYPYASLDLSPDQLRALYEILFEHEDTQRVFKPEPADLITPFVLFDKLSQDDAKHVARLLHNKNIPHTIKHPSDIKPSDPHELSPVGSCLVSTAKLTVGIFVLSIFAFEAWNEFLVHIGGNAFARTAILVAPFLFAIGLASAKMMYELVQAAPNPGNPTNKNSLRPKSPLEWLRFNLAHRTKQPIKGPWMFFASLSFGILVTSLIVQKIIGFATLGILTLAGILAFTAGWMLALHYQKRFLQMAPPTEVSQEITTAHAKSFAILPGALLATHRKHAIHDMFPHNTLTALQKLKSPALQQDFHDILELTARLFQDDRVPTLALQEALTPIFSHTATLLNQLEKLAKNTPTTSPEKILTALTALDTKLAQTSTTKHVEALLTQKTTYINELNHLDNTVHQTNITRNQLLNVRATVLDLQSQFNATELPSIEHVKHEISELQIRFEAQREVHQLLENA